MSGDEVKIMPSSAVVTPRGDVSPLLHKVFDTKNLSRQIAQRQIFRVKQRTHYEKKITMLFDEIETDNQKKI